MPSPMATTVSTWASVPALLHDLRDHEGRINKPAETLMLVDTPAAARTSAGGYYTNPPSFFQANGPKDYPWWLPVFHASMNGWQRLTQRHSNGTNILWCDGT